jgi:hypothetical protein
MLILSPYFFWTTILILSSVTRLGVSILLLPDVPSLAADSLLPNMCTRLCGGSWVIWFVFAFPCHIQRTILCRCLQASYYANWIFIIQIPGWYLKFLSSLEKQICFHLISQTQQSTCWHFCLPFILPCFMKPIIKKVLANLEYSKCRFLKHILN